MKSSEALFDNNLLPSDLHLTPGSNFSSRAQQSYLSKLCSYKSGLLWMVMLAKPCPFATEFESELSWHLHATLRSVHILHHLTIWVLGITRPALPTSALSVYWAAHLLQLLPLLLGPDLPQTPWLPLVEAWGNGLQVIQWLDSKTPLNALWKLISGLME